MQLDENTPNTVTSRPTAGAAGSEARWFKQKAAGVTGTTLPQDWFNDLLGNIRALLAAAGITRTKGASGDSDLTDAVNALISTAAVQIRVGQLERVSASVVRIRPSILTDVVMSIDGKISRKTGDLTFDMTSDLIPSEAASTPYYLYAEDVSGVLTPHIDDVPPYLPGGTKPGYHSSGGAYAGYLCCGSFWNDPSQDILPTRWAGRWAEIVTGSTDQSYALGTSPPTAWTSRSLSIPCCAAAARFLATIYGHTISSVYGASDAGGTLPSGAPGGAIHQLSASGMEGVLARLVQDDSGGSQNGKAGQFELPISDPSSPAIRWGLLAEGGSTAMSIHDLRVIGYLDLFAPTF